MAVLVAGKTARAPWTTWSKTPLRARLSRLLRGKNNARDSRPGPDSLMLDTCSYDKPQQLGEHKDPLLGTGAGRTLTSWLVRFVR